ARRPAPEHRRPRPDLPRRRGGLGSRPARPDHPARRRRRRDANPLGPERRMTPTTPGAGQTASVSRVTHERVLVIVLAPVIITGGIDLSVGSLLGLCAVILGVVWRDAGVSIGIAALAAIAIGI